MNAPGLSPLHTKSLELSGGLAKLLIVVGDAYQLADEHSAAQQLLSEMWNGIWEAYKASGSLLTELKR